MPENYITGDTTKEELDMLSEKVIAKMEKMKNEYYEDLMTADNVKKIYQLLATYLNSLETLASDKYSKEIEKKSAELGKKMNGMIAGFNASPGNKIRLPLNPGEWLSSLATIQGRIKLKTMQAKFLKEYINLSDTLVQAIYRNYSELQVPVMEAWFSEAGNRIRDQFKRSISSYLQNLTRNAENTTTIVSIEFYSKINPIYYELTDEVYRNQVLLEQTDSLMKNLARTHSSMKSMFDAGTNWISVIEEVDGLKDKLFILKDLFNKEGKDKFSFYKNFIMQNENSFKDIINSNKR
jgi:hypothetical protein